MHIQRLQPLLPIERPVGHLYNQLPATLWLEVVAKPFCELLRVLLAAAIWSMPPLLDSGGDGGGGVETFRDPGWMAVDSSRIL